MIIKMNLNKIKKFFMKNKSQQLIKSCRDGDHGQAKGLNNKLKLTLNKN
jgi:hypothetical protein